MHKANKDKLQPAVESPLSLVKGNSVKKTIALTTTDMNKELWLTFRDNLGNVLGGSTITAVTNPEPTFVITGYSIDGEEITYESEITNKETYFGVFDMVLAHNDEAPTIEIHVKNIGVDGTFTTSVYNSCDETGYPDLNNYERINIDIPSGETRSIVSKAQNTGEAICLWTINADTYEGYMPFLVGDVPYRRMYNNGMLLLIYAYNDGKSTGISIPVMDFEITDKIYNLRGQRVKNPTEKGIYIIGKKKVLVK